MTSDAPGINCGSDCEALFAQGEVVQLLPTADPSSEFAGWGGDPDCADGIVTLDADRHCSARFQPSRSPLSISQSGSRATRAGTVAVDLAWALPDDLKGIDGYEVHYSLVSGQDPSIGCDINVSCVDAGGAGTQTATVPGLNDGATYYFAARSRNFGGTQVSVYSNEICTTIGEPLTPTADFSADSFSGEAPLTVNFTAQAPGCTDSWQWDFGDGGSSTEPQPTHVYGTAGTYTVTLTVRGPGNDATGIDLTVTKPDYITVAPGAGGTGDLVAAYGFDEGSGGTVADSSGYSNVGTISGATWTTAGKYGNALAFDGSSSIVNISDADSLDLTTVMTVEAWVHPSTASGWRTTVLKEKSGGLVYGLYATDGASVPATLIYVGGPDVSAEGPADIPINAWTHLASTYGGAQLQLFINGLEVASTPVTGTIQQSTGSLRIGGNSIWGEYFSGLIDEVRIYNRALSAAEIQADMNLPVSSGAGPSCSSAALEVGSVTYRTGGHYVCSTLSITTAGPVIVPNGANTMFQAPVVSLNSGFQVQAGGVFRARP